MACSPFHVRFGKFSTLRPSEKKVGIHRSLTKVEFKVNGKVVKYDMKLGDGGEAFFVFSTEGEVPLDMQTSPLVSPTDSPVYPAGVCDLLLKLDTIDGARVS